MTKDTKKVVHDGPTTFDSSPPERRPREPEPTRPTAQPKPEASPRSLDTKIDLVRADIAKLKVKVDKLTPEDQKAIAKDVSEIAERESEPSKTHLKRLTATLDSIVAGSASLQNMHKQQLREYAKTFVSRLGV